MRWRLFPLAAAALSVGMASAYAQNSVAPRSGAQPDPDLAAAANSALKAVNDMTPEQRKAAVTAAQAQLPALVGVAADFWSKLSPQEQAAYREQLKGLAPNLKDLAKDFAVPGKDKEK